MKHKALASFALLLIVALLVATPAIADTPTPGDVASTTPVASPTPAPTPVITDVQKLAQGVFNWSFLVVLLVTAVAGALGGLVYDCSSCKGAWSGLTGWATTK